MNDEREERLRSWVNMVLKNPFNDAQLVMAKDIQSILSELISVKRELRVWAKELEQETTANENQKA